MMKVNESVRMPEEKADPKELSVLAYANGFTLWHYRSPHAWDVVISPGYFDPAAVMLRAGDKIEMGWIGKDGHHHMALVVREVDLERVEKKVWTAYAEGC